MFQRCKLLIAIENDVDRVMWLCQKLRNGYISIVKKAFKMPWQVECARAVRAGLAEVLETMKHGLLAGMAAVALTGTAWTEEINVVEAGPHHRVVQILRAEKDETGETKLVPHQWQELATGLNRWDEDAKGYVPAEVQFEQLDTGHVIARKTAHQLILSPELNAEGAVELWGPDNLYLRSTVLGVGVVDSVTGTNYLLATLKEKAELEVVSDSEVLIRDAFDTLAGDLRYSIGLNRFEQDLILREQVTPELLASLNINPRNARLFLMTEFFQPPQPQTKEAAVATTSGKTLADTTLDFGSMSIGAGRAFSEEETPTPSAAEAAVQPSVGVGKEWKVLDGRQFLIETVQYEDLAPILEKLPILDQARVDTIKDRVRQTASLPKAKTTRQAKAPRFDHGKLRLGETKVASLPRSTKGLASVKTPGAVIDYQALVTQATLTLQGDWTAVLLGTVNVSTLLTIEGGAVVKVTNAPNASIVCSGSVVCQTDFTRMGVFSSVNDNTIGEKLPASTGNPWTNYCGSAGLELRTSGQNLHHLRFAHLQRGLFFFDYSAGPNANTVSHSQFARCGTAIQANGYGNSAFANLNVRNVLIHDATNAIYGYSLMGRIEHLTAHRCNYLAWDYNGTNYGTTSTLYLTNSLLVNVTSNGNMTLNKLGTYSEASSNGVFQTVGAGGFYLAPTYPRGTGTTNINATLAADLKSLTTYPPLVLNNVVVSTNTLIATQVARNTGVPDLGYHYSPIDIAAMSLTVTNPATLTIPAGLRLATFGDAGLLLEDGGRLVAEGQAQNPIRIFRFNAVQEQSINWGNGLYEPNAILGPGHNPSNAPPVASLRFVWFDGMANYGYHLYTGSGFYLLSSLDIRDCQFRNGRARFSGGTISTIALNNNLFERVNTYYFAAPQISAYNNLHWAGITLVQRYPGAGVWTFRDNAFHDSAFTDVNGGVTNSHNAYLGAGQGQFTATAGSNVVLTSFSYTNGPLGAYYQLSTNLINAGSRNATNAGLYHHTVLASQVKEANSTVDVGYHLIALNTQTEFEVSKAGMTADASSTYAGWLPAYAINGSTNDPGWHNTSSNEEPAWLRVNLGLAYPVTRVDYCPRAGATNGTYQDYKIYVCNNNSTSLGNWGAEAAAGHWDWPNGQERKSAALLSPCGQYVIFRRITGVKGYAQANEVWIYASTGVQGEPVDSNNDGLPDYLEDRNGDGVPDPRGVADPWDGSQGTWSNYGYYPDGRLGTVYGAKGETVGVDGEGNVTRNSP